MDLGQMIWSAVRDLGDIKAEIESGAEMSATDKEWLEEAKQIIINIQENSHVG